MSPAQEIDALRKTIAKARAELRRKRRRAPILAKVNELRAYEAARRDAERMQELAGYSEGLL